MQIVWYENKALVFSSGDAPSGTASIRIEEDTDLSPAKLLQKFDNNNILYLLSDDPSAALEMFCSGMVNVRAAGGLVENGSGEILMMLRRGWWDLPKGHVEKGESCEEAALREVEEETGLHQVRILRPLGTTQHFYHTYGQWEMKRTWWYHMRSEGDSLPVPQTEEGITEIKWMKGGELWRAVGNTYGTIREVFDAYVSVGDPL